MTTEKNINFEQFPVAGIRLGVACAGIKKENHQDLVLIELSEGTQTAAVFTLNAFCAAPVLISKKHLLETQPRYLLINTGNANAGTGEQGIKDALTCCDLVANITGSKSFEVLPFSTGVIGEYLPV
ncbi:MAG: bifunctional ornithine acetyltransferase/N-acetylglutamate synthase, partial [Gammaproteobacteria bacterium]|nr:bifunctional ornithine acetyltransferase/N-acetylglutamate synthase [Gammaproteobacteria bacterium]